MAKKQSQSSQVRIISGQWRGRKLPIHDAEGLRPTTDRIKETVFNWLMADVRGARVLDCFAGSGSLSFEALSRNAEFAQLLELDKKAAKQLQQNLTTLKCDNAKVNQGDSLSLLKQAPDKPFDLVFLDPPFRKNLLEPCIELLMQNQWLTNEALIYIELESDAAQLTVPESWRLLKQKVAGQVDSRLYFHQNS
ncbi:16S rRNA (guanine(966)-N(2))-methyltransferase RsmD [Parashewanella curva]|uniref:Ribosomal RNA small subunit methyltransferase D n=1 Tax=Parashewanella curva TaxID=2338552 RepID=A0A3L8PUU6_9GAMM|nr:16S rRNA (guanine(966)-N(2))-methyltransferase RsmD [Parashewanella curva]RLV59185.1 16S rRNA (guanine(966)-N(2))-methyltransferase RsmD [Parashewanella curva]